MNLSDEKRGVTHRILLNVDQELQSAEKHFPEYNGPHEGYAIILEEVDELWSEVKQKEHNLEKLQKEAIQVAVTAIRFAKMVYRKRIQVGGVAPILGVGKDG